MARMLIVADRMLHADGGFSAGWVQVEGNVVVEAGAGDPPSAFPIERRVQVLSPGFVDIHCHGGAGASFSTTDPDEALRVAGAHRAAGTTTVVASLVTASLADMAAQVAVLAGLVQDGILAGIHLEGPWLSPAFVGAHDPALLRHPEPADVDSLLRSGAVRMVTLAPELPGGLEAVRQVAGSGAVAAVGHTDSDGGGLAAALDAGARVVTHLFNAMRPIHHRDPGPVPVALADGRVVVELIADGAHVDPVMLEWAARSARGGYALVSDASPAALAPDGLYRLGGLEVTVSGGVPRLDSSGAIAGSTLTMGRAVQVMVAAGVPPASALAAATAVPARALGLEAAGHLTPGSPADLVALTTDLEVDAVMYRGRWLPT